MFVCFVCHKDVSIGPFIHSSRVLYSIVYGYLSACACLYESFSLSLFLVSARIYFVKAFYHPPVAPSPPSPQLVLGVEESFHIEGKEEEEEEDVLAVGAEEDGSFQRFLISVRAAVRALWEELLLVRVDTHTHIHTYIHTHTYKRGEKERVNVCVRERRRDSICFDCWIPRAERSTRGYIEG